MKKTLANLTFLLSFSAEAQHALDNKGKQETPSYSFTTFEIALDVDEIFEYAEKPGKTLKFYSTSGNEPGGKIINYTYKVPLNDLLDRDVVESRFIQSASPIIRYRSNLMDCSYEFTISNNDYALYLTPEGKNVLNGNIDEVLSLCFEGLKKITHFYPKTNLIKNGWAYENGHLYFYMDKARVEL